MDFKYSPVNGQQLTKKGNTRLDNKTKFNKLLADSNAHTFHLSSVHE